MVATINWAGTWHPHYEKDPAYVNRIHPDGSFAGRWERKHLCFNTPVVREHLVPEKYVKLPAMLNADQIWIDEGIITVNLCWCPHCHRRFREQSGSEPPTTVTADNHALWTQWTTFHRESFERWMRDVRSAVDTVNPQTLVTFNHAWFVEQPETPPPFIRNLSADIHNDQLELGIYARFGGSGTIPFDLMPGLGSDIWAGVRPKSLHTILTDVALITAHGGRWNAGEYPTNFTSIGKSSRLAGLSKRPADVYMDLANKGAAFARDRQPFCQHTKPVPHVALLHAASTHYDHVIHNVGEGTIRGFGKTSDGDFRKNDAARINSRVYWPNNNPINDSVVGAYQALVDTHVHFNFTIEDRLAEDLRDAALLVLPEQHRLAASSVAAIKAYLRGGGRVLGTGSTRHAGLDDLFDYQSESPRRVNAGQTIYLGEDLFGKYHRRSGYSRRPKGEPDALRTRTARLFETLLPEQRYRLEAPPWFEWSLRRPANQDELLVHLINRRSNWTPAVEDAARPIRISIALEVEPESVSLEPGGDVLNWEFSGGKMTITLNSDIVPQHRIIRIVRKAKNSSSPINLETRK